MTVVQGVVEPGDQRGREMGFPTANVQISGSPELDGVWAGLVEIGDDAHAIAAISIGRRRTFYSSDGPRLLEAHLLNVNQDLYGKLIRVHLLQRLRPQIAFDSAEELVVQMRLDVDQTRDWAVKNHPSLVVSEC